MGICHFGNISRENYFVDLIDFSLYLSAQIHVLETTNFTQIIFIANLLLLFYYYIVFIYSTLSNIKITQSTLH
jgi:hypothetical protein